MFYGTVTVGTSIKYNNELFLAFLLYQRFIFQSECFITFHSTQSVNRTYVKRITTTHVLVHLYGQQIGECKKKKKKKKKNVLL